MENKVTISSNTSNISVTQGTTKVVQITTIGPQGPKGADGDALANADLDSIKVFTSSIQTEVNTLKASTSSYLTGNDTGSFITADQTSSFLTSTINTSSFITADQTGSFLIDTSSFITADQTSSFIIDTSSFITSTQTSSFLIDTSSFITANQTSSFLIDTSSFITTNQTGSNFITTASITNFPTEVSRSAATAGFGNGFTPSLSTDINAQNITASANISASGIVYGKTGSFSYLQGNSPITIADNVIFKSSSNFGNNSISAGTLILSGETYTTSSFSTLNQTLTFNQVNNTLSISNGNTVDLSYLTSGSGITGGSSIWSTGSSFYYVNSNLQVTGSFNVKGDITVDGHLSASSLNLNGQTFTSPVLLSTIEGVSTNTSNISILTAATSSYLTSIPAGIFSSSAQVFISQSQIVDLTHTDISALNIFTSSIQTKVNNLTAATSSYLTGNNTSSFITSAQTSSFIIDTSSFITSAQTSSFLIDTSSFITSAQTSSFITSAQTSSFLIDTSSFITANQTGSNFITTSSITDFPTEVSRSAAAAGFGAVSGSINISTDISALNTFTGSIQTEVDTLTAATSSYLTSLPANIVSSSSQILPIATSSIINFPTEVSRSAAAAGFGIGGVGSGTVTEVKVGTGLDVTNGTTTPVVTLDLTEVIAFDGNNKLLTSDADGTLTAESWIINANDLTTSGDILSIGNITSTGTISANSFSGDGSGLTGTNVAPFPYTGSATVSGSFNVTGSLGVTEAFNIDGNITASGNFKIGGNLIANGSITASSINVIELNVAGGGVPSIVSDTNIILSASNAVSIQSPVLRLRPTTTGSIAAAQNGDIMYDTNDHKFYGYANGVWVALH